MMKLIFLVLSAALLVSSSVIRPDSGYHELRLKPRSVHTYSPVGECPTHEDGPPTYLPDSEDCQIYYECSNGKAIPNVCEPELQWNSVLNVCDYPENVKCDKSEKVKPYSAVGQCPSKPGSYPVYLPDNKRCSVFYECSNGVPYKLSCAPGTLFDSVSRICVLASNARCYSSSESCKASKTIHPFSPVGECHGHEDGTPTFLPDSDDCQVYYECSNGKAIPNVCSGELQWNSELNVCDFPDKVNCEKSRKLTPYSAVGQCPSKPGSYPVYLPDDKDCKAFYECSNGVPKKLFCAPGTLFDSVSKICVHAANARCYNNCEASKNTRKIQPKTIHPFSPVGECPGHEEGPPTYLPDSEDCQIYYECSNGKAIPNVCEPELQWNSVLNVCDFPENVKCDKSEKVKPYSAVGQCPDKPGSIPVYLPDDEDCSAFYECAYNNPNGVPIKLYCAPGSLFDSVSRICVTASEARCYSSSS